MLYVLCEEQPNWHCLPKLLQVPCCTHDAVETNKLHGRNCTGKHLQGSTALSCQNQIVVIVNEQQTGQTACGW